MMIQQLVGTIPAALDLLVAISRPDVASDTLIQLQRVANEAMAAQTELDRKAGELAANAAQIRAAGDQLVRDRTAFDQRMEGAGNAALVAARALATDRQNFEAEKADALDKISVTTAKLNGRAAALEQGELDVAVRERALRSREAAVADDEKRARELRAEYQAMVAQLQAIIKPEPPPAAVA